MTIALIILPIFALILLGWGIRHWAGLQDSFWRDLERLIYFVFFPALLFHSLSHARIDFGAALPMLLTGILFTLAGMGLGWLSKFCSTIHPRSSPRPSSAPSVSTAMSCSPSPGPCTARRASPRSAC